MAAIVKLEVPWSVTEEPLDQPLETVCDVREDSEPLVDDPVPVKLEVPWSVTKEPLNQPLETVCDLREDSEPLVDDPVPVMMYPCLACKQRFKSKKEARGHYEREHLHHSQGNHHHQPKDVSLLKIHEIELASGAAAVTMYIAGNAGILVAKGGLHMDFLRSEQAQKLVQFPREPLECVPTLQPATPDQRHWWLEKVEKFVGVESKFITFLHTSGTLVNHPDGQPVPEEISPESDPSSDCNSAFHVQSKRRRVDEDTTSPCPPAHPDSEIEAQPGPSYPLDPRTKAQAILEQGRMPLVAATPRLWSCDKQVTLPGGIQWPPEGSATMTADIKLLHLEAAALRLSQRARLCLVSRRELVDTFCMLSIPGTAYPPALTDLQKARDLMHSIVLKVADGDVSDPPSVAVVDILFQIQKPTGIMEDIVKTLHGIGLYLSK